MSQQLIQRGVQLNHRATPVSYTHLYGLVKGDIDAKVELGNQQDLLLTESKEDNIKIDEKQEDEDNENNEEEQ